eukprot:scaffold14274_cov215-Skeletonema_marinoi.AAC.8
MTGIRIGVLKNAALSVLTTHTILKGGEKVGSYDAVRTPSLISIVSCDGHMCPSPILPESIDQTPTIMLSVYLGH